MDVPEDLRYTNEHVWARSEGDLVRVGITDFAQDALGEVVFVELTAADAEVAAGAPLGEVESTKSVSEIEAPVAGVVVELNTALTADPGPVNADPYGDGWMALLRPLDERAFSRLLDAAAYRELTES